MDETANDFELAVKAINNIYVEGCEYGVRKPRDAVKRLFCDDDNDNAYEETLYYNYVINSVQNFVEETTSEYCKIPANLQFITKETIEKSFSDEQKKYCGIISKNVQIKCHLKILLSIGRLLAIVV